MLDVLLEIGGFLREGLLELCEWAWVLLLALFLIAVRSLILHQLG
jgi:hypothetical protein